MNNPQISIIVPVYNVENYLHKCLDSIQNQLFTNWECLLVDDGSTDDSGIMCDEYAAKDSRFRAFHQENQGVSSARNAGIKKANGAWACFVDSDDWLDSLYLQNFADFEIDSYQLIMQSFIIEDTIRKRNTTTIFPTKSFNSNAEVVRFLEETPNVHNGFIWHRIFRLDIIKNEKIIFPEDISFAEDGWFFFDYMSHINQALSIDKIGYHYIIRKGSLTSRGRSYPVEDYSKLLRHYISTLYSFNVPNDKRDDYINFVRKYACRLMAGWFVGNAINRPKDRDAFLRELMRIHHEFSILDVHDVPFSENIMIRGVFLDNLRLRDALLYLSLEIKKWEERLARHFLSIR